MILTVNHHAVLWKKPGHTFTFRSNAQGQITVDSAEWPASAGAFPTQADVNTWATEYAARDTKEEVYQAAQSDAREIARLLRAYILCINDGSIIPATNMTAAAIKAAIKAKL